MFRYTAIAIIHVLRLREHVTTYPISSGCLMHGNRSLIHGDTEEIAVQGVGIEAVAVEASRRSVTWLLTPHVFGSSKHVDRSCFYASHARTIGGMLPPSM